MKKFTLMLGILLLAGLSFAAIAAPNWMMYSVDKYACNYAYNDMGYIGGHYAMGFMKIATIYDSDCVDPEYWNCGAMTTSLINMATALDGEKDGSGMCEYSGCGSGGERVAPSVTSFRSSMLEYNLASVSFRSDFLAGLSAYLADGGDRGAVLADLREAKADYLMCLRDVYEDGPCWTCGRPG